MNHEHFERSSAGPAEQPSNPWANVDFSDQPASVSPQPVEASKSPEAESTRLGFVEIPDEVAADYIHEQLPKNANLYKLAKGKGIEIGLPYGPDWEKQSIGNDDTLLAMGCHVLADIYLPDVDKPKRLQLIDTGGSELFDKRFLLLGDKRDRNMEHNRSEFFQFEELPHPIYFGNLPSRPYNDPNGRISYTFNFPKYVSQTHFSLQCLWDNGGYKIIITDTYSRNGTTVACNPEALTTQPYEGDVEDIDEVDNHDRYKFLRAEGTMRSVESWQDTGVMEQSETDDRHYLYGKEVINRNTNGVNGKIDLGYLHSALPILVDAESPQISALYDHLQADISLRKASFGRYFTDKRALEQVKTLVSDTLSYDIDETLQIDKRYSNLPDEPLNLSKFVDAGVGVCREQALLAASLIESLCSQGLLRGQVGVERNVNVMVDKADTGGHEWAVFRVDDNHDHDIIVDPAQNYVGPRKHNRRDIHWDYEIPR